MMTRSSIQRTLEAINIKNNFYESLNNLMDKYMVEDSIFQIVEGKTVERTKGYFEVVSEHKSFEDAMNNWNGQAIRIINNEKFQLGLVRNMISECTLESPIYDIDCGKSC